MQLQIEPWHLFSMIFMIIGGYWALARMIVHQFEKRLDEKFNAQDQARSKAQEMWDKRFSELDASDRRQERELLELKADLPKLYVQREDWIRFGATVDAKLDRLHSIISQTIKGVPNE